MWGNEVIMLLGLLLVHLASGWSELAFSGLLPNLCLLVLDGWWKNKWAFLSTLLYALENVLDLRSKASLLSLPVAFVSGSVVPSTADSLAVLQGLGAVLFWNSQRKTIAVRWVCIRVSFAFHAVLVLVISSLEFPRRLVVWDWTWGGTLFRIA